MALSSTRDVKRRRALFQIFQKREVNMDSASEISNDSMRSTTSAQSEENVNEMVFETRFRPYEDEPLADPAEVAEEPRQAGEEVRDEDGLTRRTIEARYERERLVDSW